MPARLLARILAAAALLPLLSACGIYQIVSIDPPEPGTPEDTTNIFTFSSPGFPTEQLDIFRGFELYYKFYAPDRPSINGDDALLSLQELQSRGFRRVSSGGSTDGYGGDQTDSIRLPLIPVPVADRDEVFQVQVDFGRTESNQADPQATPDALVPPVPTVTLLRGPDIDDNRPGADPDAIKPFTAYDLTDADISSDIWGDEPLPGTLRINVLLYVLSYGKDATFNDVYSIAIYLGEITVNFPVLP